MAIFDPMPAARRRRLYLFGLIPASSGNAPSRSVVAHRPASAAPPIAAPPIAAPPIAAPPIAAPPIATPPIATPPIATAEPRAAGASSDPLATAGSVAPVVPVTPVVPFRPTFRPLGEAVRDLKNPITWVFSGQSLPGQLGESSEVPLSGIVGLYVRNYLERSSDPIIDTTGPDLRVIDLLQQFETRVARFHPQVVVIGGSLIEADRGIDGLPKFERNLIRLIQACRRLGSDVVLQTPRFVASASSAEDIDGAVYVEAIKSLAAEQGVGLVDHWTAESATPGVRSRDGVTLLTRFVRGLDLPGAERQTRQVAAALH